MRIQRPNHALSILTCSIDCCRERVHIQAHFNLPLFNCLMYSVLDFDLIANERNQLQNETNKSQQTKHPSELCICQITITKNLHYICQIFFSNLQSFFWSRRQTYENMLFCEFSMQKFLLFQI